MIRIIYAPLNKNGSCTDKNIRRAMENGKALIHHTDAMDPRNYVVMEVMKAKK